jgi:hypothetical protein
VKWSSSFFLLNATVLVLFSSPKLGRIPLEGWLKSASPYKSQPKGLNHQRRGGGAPSCFPIGCFLSYYLSNVILSHLKRSGLKLQPCLTPFEQWNVGDIVPLAMTRDVAFPYILWRIFSILPLSPIEASLLHNRPWLTESKALAKSTKQV